MTSTDPSNHSFGPIELQSPKLMIIMKFISLSTNIVDLLYGTNAARRAAILFFKAVFIHELDIRLFSYSISQRARAFFPRGRGTQEYFSISNGLN